MIAKRTQFWTDVDNPDIDEWSRRVARALLPKQIPEFQRGRWLTKTSQLLDVMLIAACHGSLVAQAGVQHGMQVFVA
jgi:hypothetical protein